MTIRKNNKKLMKNEYFIEKFCKIDKLMWVFCKSDSVKQKKQVFCVKQTESFPRADVNALKALASGVLNAKFLTFSTLNTQKNHLHQMYQMLKKFSMDSQYRSTN